MTPRSTGPIFGLMNLRTINLSEQWPFGLLTIRTYGTIFGPMTIRTTDLSDYWPFGPVHDFRTNELSDQRSFEISSCPPYGCKHAMLHFCNLNFFKPFHPSNISIILLLPLQWHHNEHASVSNHQPDDYLLNGLFGRRSKVTSKLCVTGLCVGNSPRTGEFPAQKASNAENVSIWWRHHAKLGVSM